MNQLVIVLIEVILKDDKTVVIIDQNQIKGGDKLIKKYEEKTAINIYGYEPQGSSTFVKDFKFQTKITPNLMNMVTIGATSSDEKDINAIPFKKWNKGLVNRFGSTQQYTDDDDQTKEAKSNQEFRDAFAKAIENKDASYSSGNGYSFEYGNIKLTNIWAEGVTWASNRTKDINNTALLSKGLNKYKRALKKYNKKYEIGNPNSKILRSKAEADNNYMVYLSQAFGGKSGFKQGVLYGSGETKFEDKYIGINQTLYFKWDNGDFIQRGKNAFKKYLSNINKAEAEASTPVISGTGFIPLELSITMDGLSGVKIYNRLKINTKFLPSSYPKNLKFIVKGVNHKVSGNVWDTNISTISVPVSINPPTKIIIFEGSLSDYLASNILSTSYPELPSLSPPPSNELPYKEAVEILNTITTPSIAKAVFAVLFAEASKSGQAFRSAGGYNYAGVQTDAGRWSTKASSYIKARYVRKDAVKKREFAVFNDNKAFLNFMVDRITSKGFVGDNGDKWTERYLNSWVFLNLNSKNPDLYKTLFPQKLSIYNSSIRRYNQYA